uniref:Uncharacterized protein n=1 Tax=Strigamia maritima TaxID=126957 RepID=T1JB14_STRMM
MNGDGDGIGIGGQRTIHVAAPSSVLSGHPAPPSMLQRSPFAIQELLGLNADPPLPQRAQLPPPPPLSIAYSAARGFLPPHQQQCFGDPGRMYFNSAAAAAAAAAFLPSAMGNSMGNAAAAAAAAAMLNFDPSKHQDSLTDHILHRNSMFYLYKLEETRSIETRRILVEGLDSIYYRN